MNKTMLEDIFWDTLGKILSLGMFWILAVLFLLYFVFWRVFRWKEKYLNVIRYILGGIAGGIVGLFGFTRIFCFLVNADMVGCAFGASSIIPFSVPTGALLGAIVVFLTNRHFARSVRDKNKRSTKPNTK